MAYINGQKVITLIKGARDDYYATKTELANKQDKTDNSLTTTNKTIVGAINENKSNISGKINSGITGIVSIPWATNSQSYKISAGSTGIFLVNSGQHLFSVYTIYDTNRYKYYVNGIQNYHNISYPCQDNGDGTFTITFSAYTRGWILSMGVIGSMTKQ